MKTESILHEVFHAVLPIIVPYADYVLGLAVLALGAWVRARFQVKDGEIAALLEELLAKREELVGPKPPSEIKKARAMIRARRRMHVLVRPWREKRLDDVVERGVPR